MAQYSSILVLQKKKTDNRISKDIMRTQILQASLSHIQAIGLNTRDRKLQLLNIHIFILICHKKNSHTPMF